MATKEAAKIWLQERWVVLDDALAKLTVEQEDEIVRLCQAEIDFYRDERNLSLGPLGNAVSKTRKHLEAHFQVLDASNSWHNPRKGKLEHISLKYLNLTQEQWAERAAPSQEKREARLQDRKFVNDPDAVVERAVSLLNSSWQDVTVALAVLTGRRLHEVLEAGSFSPHARYTLTFKGQLKVQDKVMPAYEVPVLCEASLVLAAIDRLRSLLIAGSVPDEDQLTGVAERLFSDLVPPRAGGSLYTHLFRAVYGCIAVFFYAPSRIVETVYLNRIYGHYWITEATGKLQADYNATMHYQDYAIGDAAILAYGGKRQGVKLGEPGVTELEIFQEKKPEVQQSRKAQLVERPVRKPSKTGFSSAKPSEETRATLDDIWVEVGARIDDDVLKLLCKEHYQLKTITGYGASLDQIAALLADAAEKDSENPVSLLAELLKIKASYDALLSFGGVEEITTLLADAAADNAQPVKYLTEVLKAKRAFKAGYDARIHGKDYASMKTSELRRHKAPEAAAIRFDRAIQAIEDYNAIMLAKDLPEACWFISPAVLVDLVGGSPKGAKEHIETRKAEIDKYHADNKLGPGINRRGIPITDRITVPELPVVQVGIQAPPEISTEQP